MKATCKYEEAIAIYEKSLMDSFGPMKALSIKQPWASLILHAEKRYENRSRPTKFKGWCAIHTSKNPDHDALADLPDFKYPKGHPVWRLMHSHGCIIGFMKIGRCDQVDLDDRDPYMHYNGPFAYRIDDVKPLSCVGEPTIPAKGSLGFWDITPERLGDNFFRRMESEWKNLMYYEKCGDLPF